MLVLLYKSGIPAKLDVTFDKLVFDIEGFLVEFNKTENGKTNRFCYFNKNNFKSIDRRRNDLSDGYYPENLFLSYIQNKVIENIPIPSCTDLINKRFNFTDYINSVSVNETINVFVTNFGSPFHFYYNRIKYTFNVESNVQGGGIQNYVYVKNSEFNVSGQVHFAVRIPSSATYEYVNVSNITNSPQQYFFSFNFSNFIDTTQFTNEKKSDLKRKLILICFKIKEIVGNPIYDLNGVLDGVIPRIMKNLGIEESDLEVYANSNNPISFENYNSNNVETLKKIVFLLKKSWGYYFDPNSQLLHRSTFDTLFNENSVYDDYDSYYQSLSIFYNSLYRKVGFNELSQLNKEKELIKLLILLPLQALELLPLNFKKQVIEAYLLNVPHETERKFIVRIVKSIPYNQADDFLDFLLSENQNKLTFFEHIYKYLNNSFLERKLIQGEVSEKKEFVFAIYDLWRVSKYNFYFIPNGVILTNPSIEINPYAFFLQNPDLFQEKHILDFRTNYSYTGNGLTKEKNVFNADQVGRSVEIFKISTNSFYYDESLVDGYGLPSQVEKDFTYEKLGNFHLYHPVTLIGIEADYELQIPQECIFPAFLYAYVKEFEQLKEYDANIQLGISVTTEIALLFFTGGLNSLRYLKYTSKIYRALTLSTVGTEQVVLWTSAEGISNLISVSSSILYSYNEYLNNLPTNDLEAIERRKELCSILFFIILASAGVSLLFRIKAIRAAERYIAFNPIGVNTSAIEADVYALLNQLTNGRVTILTNIRNKINSLELNEANNIISSFDNFAPQVKETFWNDFKNLSKNEWKILNQSAPQSIARWKTLYDRNIIFKKYINVIKSQIRVNSFEKYYNYPQFEKIINDADPNLTVKVIDILEVYPATRLTPDEFNSMIYAPERLKLCYAIINNTKTGLNILDLDDFKSILASNLSSLHVEIKIESLSNTLKRSCNILNNNIERIPLTNGRLISLHNGIFDGIDISSLPLGQRKLWESSNCLNVKIQAFNGNIPIGNPIIERYLSGWRTPQKVFSVTSVSSLPHNFKDFDSYLNFQVFALKSYDLNGSGRFNDTELKFIFNFLNEHWNSGNKFVIEIESKLAVCSSCQGYLSYLRNIAAKQGKIIEYNIVSNLKIKSIKQIKTSNN